MGPSYSAVASSAKERPGKFGWVATRSTCLSQHTHGVELAFAIRFGPRVPRLALTYHGTCRNAGRAKMRVRKDPNGVLKAVDSCSFICTYKKETRHSQVSDGRSVAWCVVLISSFYPVAPLRGGTGVFVRARGWCSRPENPGLAFRGINKCRSMKLRSAHGNKKKDNNCT